MHVVHPAPRRVGLLAALVALLWLVLAPLGGVATAAPAQDAAQGSLCDGAGVNVVVDFHQLGGGVHEACAKAAAGDTAWHAIEGAGFDLTELSAYAGAICQVQGKPTDTTCTKMPPANAYWSLYVDKNGKWAFATKGATQLTMHDGDFVALSWKGGKKAAEPGVPPVASSGSSTGQGQADAGAPTSATQDQASDDGGFSWWIPVAVVVVLLLAGAAIAASRRKPAA